jgi:hypothetical protein
MSIRLLVVCLAAVVGCADVPDYDDPRQIPLEEDDYVSCENLLENGSFDTTPLGWQLSPTDIIIDERKLPAGHPFSASSGYYFAWLGGVLGASRSASQLVAVPARNMLRLTGKYFVAAESKIRVEDTVKIEIVDGMNVVAVVSFTNLDSVSDTAPFSWVNLQKDISSQTFAGKTVGFVITSLNDSANNTNFLFDSLELKPAGCF